jgi:hypothetical protein
MKLKTTLSIIGDLRLTYLTPFTNKKLFEPRSEDLFFSDGWGDEETLKKLKDPKTVEGPAKAIQITWKERSRSGLIERSGSFQSPLHPFLPEESKQALVQLYLPKKYDTTTPICIVFPMTGDQGFGHREKTFALPLIKKGIGTVILINPFYGRRRPASQKTFVAKTVQDILAMCLAASEEGRSLLQYFRNEGFRNLGVAGVSQGGMLAAIVGAKAPFPVAISSSLAPHSPEVIFTEGLIKGLVDWKALGMAPGKQATEKFRDLFQMGSIDQLPKPLASRAVFLQGAKRDLVVPQHSVQRVHEAWEGASLNWLPGTHLTSLSLHNRSFRDSVVKSFRAFQSLS